MSSDTGRPGTHRSAPADPDSLGVDPARQGTGTLRSIFDVLVYAPIGFALSAGELVPELAAKGRARAREQLRLARTIGQFAVPVVRRRSEELVRKQVAKATHTDRVSAGQTRSTPIRSDEPLLPKPRPASPPAAKSSATALPIDGYDELPASSIITLLDGLRPAQLRVVDAHERINRGRRTVLTRIAQLLA